MGRINIRDRILYVYMYTGYIMAKLYWRYKKNGKWTWKPLQVDTEFEKTLVERWTQTVVTKHLEGEQE